MKRKKKQIGSVGWNPTSEELSGINTAAKVIFLLIMVGVFLYPLFV